MGKGNMTFERVPLKQVRRLLEEQTRSQEKSNGSSAGDKRSVRNQGRSANNVQKHRAQPQHSIRTEGEDHPHGLWIDKEIFRKHQNRQPQLALHGSLTNSNNRSLALADSVLKPHKVKPKRKVNQRAPRTEA